MTLFINACVREASRTRELADHLLSRQNCPYEEVRLDAIEFPIVNQSFLEKRDRLIFDRDFKQSYSRSLNPVIKWFLRFTVLKSIRVDGI